MNPRRDGLEKLVTALDLYIGELQRMKHTFREILPYPIEPILGEWDRIIKLTEQENPEDLYEFLSVHRSGIGQLQKAFWNSLQSLNSVLSQNHLHKFRNIFQMHLMTYPWSNFFNMTYLI